MKELSLHILDIVQNSIHAEATKINIEVTELSIKNKLIIRIEDNGTGMSKTEVNQVLNPYYTTKNKKTGLGIPLFMQHAQMTGGELTIESSLRKGTNIRAEFGLNHLDRQPMGNISRTIITLIKANPEIHFRYIHSVDNKVFKFDTMEIIQELDDMEISNPEIISFLNDMIEENLIEIGTLI